MPPVLTARTAAGEGGLWAGIVPEELEAHSLPVSRSLSPSLVSATAEAGAFEQEAPTMWCLRRRRPEHLDLGLCSAANSLAPSCNQSRRQGGWRLTRARRKASPQPLGQALPPPREGEDPPFVVTSASAGALPAARAARFGFASSGAAARLGEAPRTQPPLRSRPRALAMKSSRLSLCSSPAAPRDHLRLLQALPPPPAAPSPAAQPGCISETSL